MDVCKRHAQNFLTLCSEYQFRGAGCGIGPETMKVLHRVLPADVTDLYALFAALFFGGWRGVAAVVAIGPLLRDRPMR